MASGVGSTVPDDEEPQPWRSMMLMNKSIARAENCRVWRWLEFFIRWRFTLGLGIMKLSVISYGKALLEALGLNGRFLERTLIGDDKQK